MQKFFIFLILVTSSIHAMDDSFLAKIKQRFIARLTRLYVQKNCVQRYQQSQKNKWRCVQGLALQRDNMQLDMLTHPRAQDKGDNYLYRLKVAFTNGCDLHERLLQLKDHYGYPKPLQDVPGYDECFTFFDDAFKRVHDSPCKKFLTEFREVVQQNKYQTNK